MLEERRQNLAQKTGDHITIKRNTQPTFQRRINIVSMLWINVEITLIRR